MIYTGPLNPETMPSLAKKAYIIWRRQRDRCSNPNSKSYKTYGKKGIKVEYSSRDFVNWFLKNYKKSCEVGRIDHSKNYTLDNIKFESKLENIRERNKRCGVPKKIGKKVIYSRNGFSEILINIKSASEKYGYNPDYIKKLSDLKKLTRKNERFTVMENFNG